jgi:signal transduction histidine kinase
MNGLLLQLRSGTDPVENVRPVDLEPLIRTICASKPEFRGRWDLDLSPGVAALAHGERLEHVLGHLLQNAVDATGEAGSIAVKLSEASGFAVIEISDDGTGMTPEFMQERLFKPFHTTKASGMGIGVYESLQYVNGVGGQMHYDSAPGTGTRVRVSLPAAVDSARRLATISETA